MTGIDVSDSTILDDGFVYNRPIHIPYKPVNGHRSCCRFSHESADIDFATPVAIAFNLGLAYQLISVHLSKEGHDPALRRRMMRQSVNLYKYTFRLQRTRNCRSSQSPFFFLATINNIGVMFSGLGENENSRECFNQMLALLMFMNARGCFVGGPGQFEAFFRNTAQVSHVNCCIGAAAA